MENWRNMNIQKRIKYLVDEIRRHNFLYHTLDTPEITDDEYDDLFKELKDLEKQYPQFIIENSPTTSVGGSSLSMLTKITRVNKMYSLDKVHSLEELITFFEDMESYTCGNAEVYVDAKLDGLAIELTYMRGKLVLATTRGDGVTGEAVTDNIRHVNGVPSELRLKNPPELLQIRGEVVMHKRDFIAYNKKLVQAGREPLANTRNGASGAVRQLAIDMERLNTLYFYAYGIGNYKPAKKGLYDIDVSTHGNMIVSYANMGIAVPPAFRICRSKEELVSAIEDLGTMINKLPMGCDGAVIILNDRSLHTEIGYTSRHPKFAIAFKYPTASHPTKLIQVKSQVGRTGVITPVAVFEPVTIDDVVVSRATLHNWDEVARLDLHENDTIFVTRANNVIPKITGVDIKRRVSKERITIPEKCPYCSTKLLKLIDKADYICNNPNCVTKTIRSIVYFGSRSGVNITDLGVETVTKLLNNQLITDAADLYTLTVSDLTKIGFGLIESSNLVDSIQKTKTTTDLASFIQALGIPNVGASTASTLASKFEHMDGFMESVLDEMEWEDIVKYCQDIGKVTARSISDYFTDPDILDLMYKFKDRGLWPKSKPIVTSGKLSNMIFAITGSLSISRNELRTMIYSNGGSLSETVNKSTTYLIVGEKPSSKVAKARKLGITTLTEEQFMNML